MDFGNHKEEITIFCILISLTCGVGRINGGFQAISSADKIFFEVTSHLLLRGSCCPRKLLVHITLQSRVFTGVTRELAGRAE